MSRAAVKMTAEHLGKLLGLFTRKCRLPAAVEMRESGRASERASGGRREARQKRGRRREERQNEKLCETV